MNAIITKYATTSGVFIKEVEENKGTTSRMCAETGSPGIWHNHYHGNDWHTNQEDALKEVRARFAKKKISLEKQLTKLDKKLAKAIEEINKFVP